MINVYGQKCLSSQLTPVSHTGPRQILLWSFRPSENGYWWLLRVPVPAVGPSSTHTGPRQILWWRASARVGPRQRAKVRWSAIVRFWIFRPWVFAKQFDWRSLRVFRCNRGVEIENRKNWRFFIFTSVKTHRSLTLPMLTCWSAPLVGPVLYKKWEHCKSSYCTYKF